METKDLQVIQKFLVLIDFSKSSYQALKYAISWAKIMEVKLILLYVARPRDVIESDNPSVVLRAIDIATSKAEAQLKSMVEMIEAEDVLVEYHNTVGDVPIKTKLYIELHKPTLVVLGKTKYGENKLGEITEYLLYQFTGNLLIVGNEVEFNIETKISVECSSENLKDYGSSILIWLNKKTKAPLIIFVNKRKRSTEKFTFPENWQGIAESSYKICVKNRQSFSLVNTIIEHISKEKIDLFCIGRKGKNKSIFAKLFNQSNTTSDIINNARIPTLIMGGH